MPAIFSIASGYEHVSFSITNEITFPPFPEEKSFHIFFTGETINEAVLSSLKGDLALKFDPARFNSTYLPMTSSICARSKSLSIKVDFI